MPFSVNGILCTLALLVLWRTEELVEACSCAPVHPQQAFCNADVGEYRATLLLLLLFTYSTMLHQAPDAAAQPASGALSMGSEKLLQTAGEAWRRWRSSSRPSWLHCIQAAHADTIVIYILSCHVDNNTALKIPNLGSIGIKKICCLGVMEACDDDTHPLTHTHMFILKSL